MNAGSYFGRARIVFRALRLARERTGRHSWSRDQLLAFQRARLGETVEYASRRSAFYRRLYGGHIASHEVELSRLPTVSKAAMMLAFDELVTDPRLERESVDAHLAGETPEALHLGEYCLLNTSGSTGLRGVYAFSRAEWLEVMGIFFTGGNIIGIRPSLPRKRIAIVGAPNGRHISFRQSATADVGLYRILRRSASSSLDELVADLARFTPHGLAGYPSVLSMLAQEQQAGRLRIAPRWINTFAELRTEEMTERIRSAWGVEPFNTLGMTEGSTVAVDCAVHAGMHVLEDSVILENVDEAGRPVAPGTLGAKLLLTNLWQRTQPLIRFEISDLVTFDERPCACGRNTKRIVAIEGRSDDLLELPTAAGSRVAVHPIHLRSPLGALAAIAQYQIIQEGDALSVAVVPARGQAHDGLTSAVQSTVEAALCKAGIGRVAVRVDLVDHLERAGGGKLKLVERRRSLQASRG